MSRTEKRPSSHSSLVRQQAWRVSSSGSSLRAILREGMHAIQHSVRLTLPPLVRLMQERRKEETQE